MAENSTWMVGRNAAIGAFIAILVNPLGIPVGYWLSQKLAEPDLRCQYVNANPNTKPFTSTNLDKVISNLVLNRLLSEKVDNWCKSTLNDGQIMTFCIDPLKTAIEGLLRYVKNELDMDSENLRIITAWDGQGPLVLQPTILLNSEAIISIAQRKKSYAIDMINGYIVQLNGYKIYMEKSISDLEALRATEAIRDGTVSFNIGILNAGDSDGTVPATGDLSFGESHVVIRNYGGLEKYSVVKTHSFEEIPFYVDDKATTKDALDKWHAIVKSRQQESFNLSFEAPTGVIKISGRLPP
jgi:hypothetical protein